MTDGNVDQQPFNDKKLFVGNLAFSITNTELENLFRPVSIDTFLNVKSQGSHHDMLFQMYLILTVWRYYGHKY